MTGTRGYFKPIHLMVALALVLSLGAMLPPTIGSVEASTNGWESQKLLSQEKHHEDIWDSSSTSVIDAVESRDTGQDPATASIRVSPARLGAELTTDTVQQYTLCITNDGDSVVDYSISDVETTHEVSYEWHTETVDSEGYVGIGSSLALDSNDNPRISYYDRESCELKYAQWDGASWRIEIITSVGANWSSVSEAQTSLAIGTDGNPRVSFWRESWREGGGLKYAEWDGEHWDVETICPDGYYYNSLALDSDDNPRVAFRAGKLMYARKEGSVWKVEEVTGVCGLERVNSLALDSNDNPHISYYSKYGLRYAWWDGSWWHSESVDYGDNIGQYNSLALDSNNNPHIAYYIQDGSCGRLCYAHRAEDAYSLGLGGAPGWSTQGIDSGGNVGLYTSLALDSNESLGISYYDADRGDLKYHMRGVGDWWTETVDSEGNVGLHSSIAFDSNDNPRISYGESINYGTSVWDGNLKYAWREPLSPDCPWLEVTPATGPIAVGDSVSVIVTVNSTGLAERYDSYSANMVLNYGDSTQEAIVIPFTLRVGDNISNILLSIADVEANEGECIKVPISLTNVTEGTELCDADISLSYSPDTVEVVDVASGNLSPISRDIDNTEGITKIECDIQPPGKTGDFVVAYVTLQAVGNSGQSSNLELANDNIRRWHRSPTPCSICNGIFRIVSLCDIAVSPPSFEVTLSPGGDWSGALTIANEGDGDLSYSISDRETTGMTGTTGSQPPLSKPATVVLEIPLEGNPVEPENASELGSGWQNIMRDDCPWLDENPKLGTVEPSDSEDITVTIDTTGLPEGDYSAEIVIANNDTDEDPSIVPVSLAVSPPSDNDNPDVATGLASIEDELVMVYNFDNATKTWTWYNPSWPAEQNTLDTLYKGKAYWIKVSADCVLACETQSYDLYTGWNNIPLAGLLRSSVNLMGLASILDNLLVVHGFDDGTWT